MSRLISSILTESVCNPSFELTCPKHCTFSSQNKHLSVDNFKLHSDNLFNTISNVSRSCSNLLLKSKGHLNELHIFSCSGLTKHWKVAGIYERLNGILLYSKYPNGPIMNAVLLPH